MQFDFGGIRNLYKRASEILVRHSKSGQRTLSVAMQFGFGGIRSLYKRASGTLARHPKLGQRALSAFYTFGDSIILAMPAVESGFFGRLWAGGQADWPLLLTAYLDRPLPFAVSCIFVGGSLAMAKSFSKGHAGQLVGVSLLMTDLVQHDQLETALAFLPSVVGCLAGAFYSPLEKKFSEARCVFVRESIGNPKRLAGLSFAVSNVPAFYFAVFPHITNAIMAIATLSWIAGNSISALLPKDTAKADPPLAMSPS